MAFARTPTQPATDAPVTVEFAGLMLLRPGADNTCSVGVHRWTYLHTFQAVLVVQKPRRPPTLIRLLTGPLSGPFVIRLEEDQPGDFKAYAATAGALERNDQNAQNYPLDYRWAINVRQLHYDVDWNDGIRPMVILKTGVLYTPNLTPRDLDPRFVRSGVTEPLHYFSADLAAEIAPPANKVVRLEWSELGNPQSLTLPREQDPVGTVYTVALSNEPPMSYPPSHDELALYYDVLTVGGALIPPDNRWRLEYDLSQRTDEIPCMPGIIEP